MTINSVIYALERQDGNDNSKRNMMSFESHEGNYSFQQTGVAEYTFSYNSKGNKTIIKETKSSVLLDIVYNSKGNEILQQTGVADYKGDRDIIDETVADVANRKAAEPWVLPKFHFFYIRLFSVICSSGKLKTHGVKKGEKR